LQLGADRQTCFGRSGGFAPMSLPLFQGVLRPGWQISREIPWSYSSITKAMQKALTLHQERAFLNARSLPFPYVGRG
jgi:hypothetical protein